MKTTAMTGSLVALMLAMTACDLQLLPEAGTYEGAGTPRMSVVVQADAMPSDGVVAVDFELVDVLLHRERDDAWVWVAGDASRVELSFGDDAEQPAVPLHADHYDRMLVVVDAPRVAKNGKWHRAHLVRDEIELPIDLVLDGDASVELQFDLVASLAGSGNGKWRFDPRAVAQVRGE